MAPDTLEWCVPIGCSRDIPFGRDTGTEFVELLGTMREGERFYDARDLYDDEKVGV
jgi:hypothetical protein